MREQKTLSGPVHIALTFDDNFWAPAVATIRSTCIASGRRPDLTFHLVHKGLSAEHRADIDAVAGQYGATINHYPLEQKDFLSRHLEHLPKSATPRWTEIVYARLFIQDVLPPDIDRLVYLDADVYVRRPIETLYETDLGGNVFGACEDVYHVEAQVTRTNTDKLGLFQPWAPQFNSGVLVIDLKQWAEVDILGEFRALMGSRHGEAAAMNAIMMDQDVLNLVFRGRWKVLDYRWNFQNPVPAHEQLFPYIVHYCGEPKPWFLFSKLAFARRYRHLMTNELFYRYMRFRWKRDARKWLDRQRARFGLAGRT